jgi:hypothetical protein
LNDQAAQRHAAPLKVIWKNEILHIDNSFFYEVKWNWLQGSSLNKASDIPGEASFPGYAAV